MCYALRSGFVALVLAGCMGDDWPAPPPVSFDEFAQEPGELVFRADGREHSLIAVVQSERSTSYFVMMWD